jgi:hypothetical protein
MRLGVTLAAIGALMAVHTAHAHHSFAMFDQETNMTIEGTVTEFEFVNPHSWLYVETTDETGQTAEWTIEMGGPGAMSRSGWTAETVKPGDQITVEIHPMKDGTYGGQYLNAVLADGTSMEGGDSGLAPAAR